MWSPTIFLAPELIPVSSCSLRLVLRINPHTSIVNSFWSRLHLLLLFSRRLNPLWSHFHSQLQPIAFEKMQFTSKFILLAVALAYGSTAVSAAPVGESPLDAREVEDMELFVRDPFSLFGFGTPSRTSTTPSRQADDSHRDTGAGLTVSPFELERKFKPSDNFIFFCNRGRNPKPLLRHLPCTRKRQNQSCRRRAKKKEVHVTIPSQLWT